MQAWGRLTLQSGKPRMDVDVSGSTIYYTPFENNDFSELSLSLSGITTGNLYDVYLNTSNSTLSLTSAWTNNTTPSVTRTQTDGLYFDSNGKLYLGTIYAGTNDTVCWQVRPTPSAYGTNNDLGVFNAYNRLPIIAICRDTTTSWTYSNTGLRYANNSNLNRINWVDGLGDVECQGEYIVSTSGISSSASAGTVGVGLDQNSYPINWDGLLSQAALNSTAYGMQISGKNWTNGSLGRHNWQAMEETTSVGMNFFGNNFMCLTATLSL